ncbi:hypothetical protein ACFPES_26605 [Paenibacillus sp. GCM10023248]|uniref:hypothetical protein n=1 Tax=Bacillales TaxID=1385 RepID=UPI0023786206|nr:MULTISPECIES: hypothetical protein [Bacillales]MDD9270632.1 hypothetical protein [Paenibacillus sp. MAHUQ-63]MDR6884698.1 hypothetical protein [Bacillus sp. 3255]
MRKYAPSSDLLNRWVELAVTTDHVFKFFLTYMNPYYLGGHLSRSSLLTNDASSPPLRYNQWNFIKLHSGASVNFFLTEINDHDIAGHLVRSEIANIDFTIIRYQQFFEAYACRFRPALAANISRIPPEERRRLCDLVQRAEQTLQARVALRELAARSKRIPQAGELPALDDQDLRYLSDAQLELYSEFHDHDGQLDYEAVQTGFELYGNGELRSSKYPGHLEPDPAVDFLFAEFALHAIEREISPDIWSKLLIPLVEFQELFIQTCAPTGKKDTQQPDPGRIEHLRRKYDAMSVQELQRAYADNLLKACSLTVCRRDNEQP